LRSKKPSLERVQYDTKIAVVLCDYLAVWQKTNVTAFWSAESREQCRRWSASHTGMRRGNESRALSRRVKPAVCT
jgi:hypothetical protein